MIPAHGRYQARFRHDPTKPRHLNPPNKLVEAFNSNGEALVVNDEGFLVPAMTFSTFYDVIDLDEDRPIGVLPGGGWHLRYTDPETKQGYMYVVVGWVVAANGETTPIVADGQGASAATWTESRNVELVPPDLVS